MRRSRLSLTGAPSAWLAAMTEARVRPGWLGISIFLGIYAALLALVHDPIYKLIAAAPLLLICVAWWTLKGAPDRWVTIFLCAAVLLPPLPITLGDSGPHPSLVIATLGLLAGVIRLFDWRF